MVKVKNTLDLKNLKLILPPNKLLNVLLEKTFSGYKGMFYACKAHKMSYL